MDINSIESVIRPRDRDELGDVQPGDAWLAGGTWLFSESQVQLKRLIDIGDLGWPPIEATPEGLVIAATCTIATLNGFEAPATWRAGRLIGECCRAFLASFKIWNAATVGGNLCLGLPAGPMIALCAALDGTCSIWTPPDQDRSLPALDLVIGPQQNALRPGELLRSVTLPAEAMMRRTAFRQISLTPLGRSAALLIGTRAALDVFSLTITAATRRPMQLRFPAVPGAADLRHALDAAIPFDLYYDDIHGQQDWRQHLTRTFAEEIRLELTR